MMRVAVITPYFRETLDVLRVCHNSVLRQTHACTHFLISDGVPQEQISSWDAQHIRLPSSHADAGNTPRAIGSLSAMNQGFDAVAYLDADNGYYPNHIQRMVELHERTRAAVCTASRTIHRPDGSFMLADTESDGVKHVDTSCYFVTAKAFEILPRWAMMPRQLGPICDRIMWQLILSLDLSTAQCTEPTVAFRTQYECHYKAIGESAPAGVKRFDNSTGAAWEWWALQPPNVQAQWMRRIGLSSW